jgi:hypothetical protein
MICAQAVINFRPDASYEKYLKLLMGVMVLILILKPVMSLFGENILSAGELQNDIYIGRQELTEQINQEIENNICEETLQETEQNHNIYKDNNSENDENDKDNDINIDTINIAPVNVEAVTLD